MLYAAALVALAAVGERPNILFILSDDHAQRALSCYGSTLNTTPGLDRLAREGLRFENAFVTNSICSPSRASILTGKYSHRNGVPTFNRFDGSQPTVAKHLQAAGYHTGMIGKWHLGGEPTGFDRWTILPGQGAYVDASFLAPEGRIETQGHVTGAITDLGLEFLRARPKEKPFFLMLHHKAPHRNWVPDAANRERFRDADFAEPATLHDDYATRPAALPENRQTIARDLTRRDLKLVPPAGLGAEEQRAWLDGVPLEVEIARPDGTRATLTGAELVHWKYQRFLQDYLACVHSLDDNVGRLLDWLDAHGLGQDTVVIVTSDNGFFLGEHGWYDKRWMYEQSLRVPLLVRWPGASVGRVPDAFALNVDLAPTCLEIAGLPVPAGVQGSSLGPILHDQLPIEWRQVVYYRYYEFPGTHSVPLHYGVRSHTHKLIWFPELQGWEMYELEKDPYEEHNVADEKKVKGYRKHLEGEMQRLRTELGDDDQVRVR